MKNTKKFAVMLAVIAAMTASIGSIQASAVTENATQTQAECKGDPGYGISNISLEKQLEEFLADPDLTAEQKEAAKEKVEEAIMLRDSGTYAARTTYSTVTLGVPSYTQKEVYYCGPATARQTIGFFGLSVPGGYTPPSQDDIADDIGTTTAGTEWYMLRNYVNSYTFMGVSINYIEYTPTSVSNMEAVAHTAMVRSNRTPPILQVNTYNSSGVSNSSILGYNTGGHYMNISGISTQSGVNYFRLTDPYRGKVGLSSVYNVKTSDIYTITRNHWAKHFLY